MAYKIWYPFQFCECLTWYSFLYRTELFTKSKHRKQRWTKKWIKKSASDSSNDITSKNFYYLKALQKNIFIFTYVENDGLYEYANLLNETKKISCEELIDILKNQNFDININPDKLFIPSNYLVSPFNSTERFLDGEYFSCVIGVI